MALVIDKTVLQALEDSSIPPAQFKSMVQGLIDSGKFVDILKPNSKGNIVINLNTLNSLKQSGKVGNQAKLNQISQVANRTNVIINGNPAIDKSGTTTGVGPSGSGFANVTRVSGYDPGGGGGEDGDGEDEGGGNTGPNPFDPPDFSNIDLPVPEVNLNPEEFNTLDPRVKELFIQTIIDLFENPGFPAGILDQARNNVRGAEKTRERDLLLRRGETDAASRTFGSGLSRQGIRNIEDETTSRLFTALSNIDIANAQEALKSIQTAFGGTSTLSNIQLGELGLALQKALGEAQLQFGQGNQLLDLLGLQLQGYLGQEGLNIELLNFQLQKAIQEFLLSLQANLLAGNNNDDDTTPPGDDNTDNPTNTDNPPGGGGGGNGGGGGTTPTFPATAASNLYNPNTNPGYSLLNPNLNTGGNLFEALGAPLGLDNRTGLGGIGFSNPTYTSPQSPNIQTLSEILARSS